MIGDHPPLKRRFQPPPNAGVSSTKRACRVDASTYCQRKTEDPPTYPAVQGQTPDKAIETCNSQRPVELIPIQRPKPERPYPHSFSLRDLKGLDELRPHSLYTRVSDWLQGLGQTDCRSENGVKYDDGYTSQQVTRLAVEVNPNQTGPMSCPPTSTKSQSNEQTSSEGSQASVRKPLYRQQNLRYNNIRLSAGHLNPSTLPDIVSQHVNDMRVERDSPQTSPTTLNQAMIQFNDFKDGCTEADLVAFLDSTVVPNTMTDPNYGRASGLTSSTNALMSMHLVPSVAGAPLKVVQPKPNRLYGYSDSTLGPFNDDQLLAQSLIHPQNPDFTFATTQGMRFPFFAIEFKADGPSHGGLWVATNQCAGASSACVNVVAQLSHALSECRVGQLQGIKSLDDLSYSIAVGNREADLFVSWREDRLKYLVQRVDTFNMTNPEHFQAFRRHVRNILDWGKGPRLDQIKMALNFVLEENQRRSGGQ